MAGLAIRYFQRLVVSIATFYKKFSKIFVQKAWGMKLLDTGSFSPVGREPHPLSLLA